MVAIVLAIVLGIGFTIVALGNRTLVPVNFLGLTTTLPLFAVGALTFLLGIFVTLFYHLFDMISASFDLSKKDSELNQAIKTNQNLASDLQKMKLENAHLQEKLGFANSKLNGKRMEVVGQKAQNFFDKVKHALRGDNYSTPRESTRTY